MTFSLPTARTALLTAIQTALTPIGDPTITPIQVARGALDIYVAPEQVVMGHADWTAAPANIGQPLRYDETYDISCRIRVHAGDLDFTTRETRAEQILQAIATQIDTDTTLSGAVLRAYVSTCSLESGKASEGGSAAELDFTIHVTAQTT